MQGDCGAERGGEMTILRPIDTRFKVTYPPSKSSTDWMAIEYECDDRP